jgi:hypothetical protein
MTPYYGTIIYLILYKIGWIDWLFTIASAGGLSCVYVYLLEIAHNTNPKNNEEKKFD